MFKSNQRSEASFGYERGDKSRETWIRKHVFSAYWSWNLRQMRNGLVLNLAFESEIVVSEAFLDVSKIKFPSSCCSNRWNSKYFLKNPQHPIVIKIATLKRCQFVILAEKKNTSKNQYSSGFVLLEFLRKPVEHLLSKNNERIDRGY